MTPRPTADFPHTLRNRDEVYAFFRSWGYNVQPTEWDFSELPERARELIGEMHLVAHQDGAGFPFQVFLVELKRQHHEMRFRKTFLSPILEPFYRMFPQGEYLFVFARPDGEKHYSGLSFVSPKRVSEGRRDPSAENLPMFPAMQAAGKKRAAATKLRMRILSPEFPNLTHTERQILENIRLSAGEQGAQAVWDKVRDAFSVEKVTEAFYREYRTLFEELKQALVQSIPDLAKRHAFVQRLLSRLLFLCFLQKKRWLDQNPRFLYDLFDHAVKQKKDFYSEYLHALFFEALNNPEYMHSGDGRLGIVPFLNGGLFEKVEPFDEPGAVRLGNDLFERILGEDGLLRRYNFTITESTPYTQEIAVDPEMLGKVFESVVLQSESAVDYTAPDLRKATGSYYTPRIVVHFIVREVLRQTLAQRVPGEDMLQRLGDVLEIDASDGLNDDELERLSTLLTQSEAGQLMDVLADLKACDPAVGSGAFAVGLLQELVNLSILCETRQGGKDPREVAGKNYLARTKRDLIERSIYGVDIQPQAVEICKLRLWLSLAVDVELSVDALMATREAFTRAIKAVQPLPNLSYKIRRGDALLDQIHGQDFLLEKVQADSLVWETQKSISAEQKAYFDTNSPREKYARRLRILTERLRLAERYLGILRKQVGVAQVSMFGETPKEKEARRQREAQVIKLDAALGEVQTMQANLVSIPIDLANPADEELVENSEAGSEDAMTFAWRFDFPEVFERKGHEGFDIVVGNPPFVTARSADKRQKYQERWKQVAVKNFQLVSPFFARGFGILAPNGQLGFIVSNAFAKREFGKPLVEEFFRTVELQKVVDCSGLMFPGHGTPTCIVFGKQPLPGAVEFGKGKTLEGSVLMAATLPGGGDLRTAPEDSLLWLEITEHHDDQDYHGTRMIVEDQSRAMLSKWPWKFIAYEENDVPQLVEGAKLLKDLCAEPIGAQFITGKDDAYVVPPDYARRMNIPHENVKIYATGEDVRDWMVEPTEVIIFPYNTNLETLKEPLPSALQQHFGPYQSELENVTISSSIKKKETKLKWFEFRRLARAKFQHKFNIINPQIATHGHFVISSHTIAYKEKAQAVVLKKEFDDNKIFAFAAVLNSSLILDRLKQTCFSRREAEQAESGTYYEFAGNKIEELAFSAILLDASELQAKLSTLSRACWERGQILPSLAMKKLFEQAGEAYHAWNGALAGYVQPHEMLAGGFATFEELAALKAQVIAERERLRGEMIALQEEMDWLVYRAYGLTVGGGRLTVDGEWQVEPLALGERPFELLKAGAEIPAHFSAERRALWQARIETIEANEHIRRIEQPVYKRRWYNKEGYEQEFNRAFEWFLLEKAEYYLEHQANGGPIVIEAWASALWNDARLRATASVIGGANGMSLAFFTKLFKSIVDEVTVPAGIPAAEAWESLDKRMSLPAKVKRIRGKLNVPRERFWVRGKGEYLWAGKGENHDN